MHVSRNGELCHVEIFRRGQGSVIADGGDDQHILPEPIQTVLKRHGFEAHFVPPTFRWYALPTGLGEAEENARTTRAVAELVAGGWRVELDPELYDPRSDERTLPPSDVDGAPEGDG
ncbi:hypothetical protein [Streptomyces sp. SBT349]|uniref:hypothetical protein n=1 Tax=Streptomyces sp. SBT349 TaxID=1580539 RepID=UPI00066CF897|nr:hypothetical protein [Streptomyces sp. SBT349]